MRAAAAAAAVAAILAGCGGSAGDLLALEVSDVQAEEPVRLVVTEDGRGRCDDRELEPIPSRRLIQARQVERELEPLATDGATFDSPGEARSYVARSQDGIVRWVERAPRLPKVLRQAELLAERLREDLC